MSQLLSVFASAQRMVTDAIRATAGPSSEGWSSLSPAAITAIMPALAHDHTRSLQTRPLFARRHDGLPLRERCTRA